MRSGLGTWWVFAVTGLAATCVLSACSNPDRSAVSDVARSFVSAIERKDGTAACQLLTDSARKAVPGATSTPCATAIVSVNEDGSQVGSVQVWGDAAQVHVAGDVVFLLRFSGAWQISAAGCTPQPAGPYECQVG